MMAGTFLQSEEWRRFQEAAGHKTVGYSGETLSGIGIIHRLPLAGQYLYFPRGPQLKTAHGQFSVSQLKREMENLGKKEKAGWLRIEPKDETELLIYRGVFGKKLVKAPHDMQPRENLVVDITEPEETLLSRMKSKTRYNIRLAEKKGTRVFRTQERKYREVFLDLMVRTADRKSLTPHPRSYYEKFFSAFQKESFSLFVAEYEGKVLAANLVLFHEDTAIYLHGGSSDEYREMMAPYLLQWEQIRFARSCGMKQYDFGGVKTGDPLGPWAGITRFKQGFAPATPPTLYPGSYDIVLDSAWYFFYIVLSHLHGTYAALRKKL